MIPRRGRVRRLIRILWVVRRFGLDELVVAGAATSTGSRLLLALTRFLRFGTRAEPRGVRLRQALESLGPISVKFGQVLSTRRDLLPPEIASELSLLQDRVPPFPGAVAVREIERGLGHKLDQVFSEFEMMPVASASIAQVHFARLRDGREVAVKVLRPGMRTVIEEDLDLLRAAATLATRVSSDARRLRPLDVIAEFDHYLHDELDLIREAANANQLRRNFRNSKTLRIPEMFWDYCADNVLVMERVAGIPVGRVDQLIAAGIDLKKLSSDGVDIFFTQVFRDGFFHADMHPGNILIGDRGADFNRYIALDFGIVGTLSDFDKAYLAQNFVAFFRRDYRRVAQLHVESGWVPAGTRVEELEGAIRGCCEPVFDRPLREISLGLVLMRLFQASRRFNVSIQPQLVLLQKTLLNVEGLGRQLNPDLDLWVTAKPILERWMHEQIGLRGLIDRTRYEAPQWAQLMPQLPRLVHAALAEQGKPRHDQATKAMIEGLLLEQRSLRRTMALLIALIVLLFVLQLIPYLR